MKNLTILILPFLFSCTTNTEPAKPFTEAPVAVCPTVDSGHTPQLLWSTAGFDAPESIFYYDDSPSSAPVYFVSNVVGSPVGKDGKGWISTVSMQGKILKKKFAEGLNAPKGLYARKGNLWVSDIDRVVSFSTNDGKERNLIKVSDAKSLNDISFIYENLFLLVI